MKKLQKNGVGGVRGVGARPQFTTPRLIPVAFGATACAITPVVKSGRRDLMPGTYATGTSHPVQFSWHPDKTEMSDCS